MKELKNFSGENTDKLIKKLEITQEDKEKIKELSKNPEIFNLITNSIVPSIYGHDDIKEAIALQLFGGVDKAENKFGTSNELNILIVGDSGIGKTHILKWVSEHALNGIYIDSNRYYSGRSSKHLSDGYDLQNIKEAMNISENCLVCIDALQVKSDELVNIREALGKHDNFNTREELLNILNSNFSVLAATNPKFGRFDSYKSIEEQINLPLTVLYCFDLIFLVEDRSIVEEDVHVARHLLKFHQDKKIDYKIDPLLLQKYICYARNEIQPQVTDEVQEMILEFYVRVRQRIVDDDLFIPFTVRQIESLIKLSEAYALIRLSKEVTVEDVKKAIGLLERSLKHMGYDPSFTILKMNYDK